MDTTAGRRTNSLGRTINILVQGTSETTHRGILDGFCDGLDGFEVALTGNRKAGLYHIHAQFLEHLGNTQLLVLVHGGARALFAITESSVKNDQVISCGHWKAPIKTWFG